MRGPRLVASLGSALLCAGILMGLAPAAAQSTDDDIQILSVDSSNHPNVVLSVAIPPDFADGPLSGSDFAITEEGSIRPTASTDLRDSIEVVLAIDTSFSMQPNNALGSAKQAAETLIAQLPPETEIAVVGFGTEVLVASDLSSDREQISQAIADLDFSGDTALWDALNRSANLFRPTPGVSRYVVVLTDGVDDGSETTQSAASSALLEAEASVYAVALQTNISEFTALSALTAEVGGGFSTAESADALDPLYTEIGERLQSRYRLEFDAQGFGDREVVISVATESGLATVRRVIDVGGIAPVVAEEPSEAAAASTQLTTITGTGAGLLGQGAAYWVGVGAIFVALAVLAFLMQRPVQRVQLSSVARTGETVSGFSERLTSSAGGYLAGTERGSRLDSALDAAGMEARPGEVFVLTVVGSIFGFLLGFALSDLTLAIGLALLAPLIVYAFIARRLRSRREAFADQLESTLTMMAGALRAGRAVPQTLDLVAEEGSNPTNEEFQRVIIETRVGRDLVVAMEQVARRMKSEDFSWVAEAVAINRELGGDLAEVFENIAAVIRDRNQVRQQVKALSAEGRMSASVLVGLPVALFFYIQVANPEYGAELLRGAGLIALLSGIVLIFFGWIWMRNLTKLEY